MTAFIDTNVLLYAASPDPAEQHKHLIANRLLEHFDCALSVQVLNEFIHQVTRPNRSFPIERENALILVEAVRRFPIHPIDLDLFDRAATLARRTNYRWWDCLIVAAAIASGCDRLLTQDMQHGRVIDGVRIENPFRDAA